MLTVDEALHAVLSRAQPLPPRACALAEALDCPLAEDVAADLDLPPFDKALVDGYAVRAVDINGPTTRLRVVEEITAGRTPSQPIGPGEAAAIMTGAPLPIGADAVVMIETTRREGETAIIEAARVKVGQNRLTRGRELRVGDIVIERGARLNPARIGLLASVGRVEALVVPRPTVAIVPTGDELVEPDRVPGPGQIRNSNAALLRALVTRAGARADVRPIAPDEAGPLAELLRQGLEADVLLITGGVSAGRLDLVPATLEGLGVARVFHKVRLRPGKPLWFGIGPPRGEAPGTLVFGLPGNPVSGIVGFRLFVAPALAVLAGRASGSEGAAVEPVRLSAPYTHAGDRPTYHPARRGEVSGTVEVLDWAGSADLRTVARADGFAVFPAGDRDYDVGAIVDFLDLG